MKEQLPENKNVVVVGADHSPWTQAVVFGLTTKGYSVTIRPFPPTFRAYLLYGLVVPVCQWPDGSLTSNSFDILAKLYNNEDISDESHKDQVELEKLFLSYVSERVGPGRWLPFVHGWARMRDAPQTPTSIAMRALLTLYFVLLLAMARRTVRSSGLKTGNNQRE